MSPTHHILQHAMPSNTPCPPTCHALQHTMPSNTSCPPTHYVLQHNATVLACLAIAVEGDTQWYGRDTSSPAGQPWSQEGQRRPLFEGRGSPPSTGVDIPCEYCAESFAIEHVYSHQVKLVPVHCSATTNELFMLYWCMYALYTLYVAIMQ